MMTEEKMKQKISMIGSSFGFKLFKTQMWVMNFEKNIEGERIVINVYWNKMHLKHLSSGNPLFTVQTAIRHPKKGRTQLNRKGISFDQLITLFENPRQHTGKGYHKRKF